MIEGVIKIVLPGFGARARVVRLFLGGFVYFESVLILQ
jgi:hypothetical protein